MLRHSRVVGALDQLARSKDDAAGANETVTWMIPLKVTCVNVCTAQGFNCMMHRRIQ